jgi:hypothetical protein
MMSGVVCVLLAIVATGFDSSAYAACILQPNQQAPEGAHWSLHTDSVTNRRCWILVDSSGRDISTPQEQSAVSSLQSFLSKLTGSPPAPTSQEAPASPAANPPRKPQPHVATVNRAADQPVRTEQKSETHPARHEMTPGERDALFEEFLRWHESQQITGAGKSPASR